MSVQESEWKGRTVVYTAVIGDFEHLGDHCYNDGVDYVFFTNGDQFPINPRWRVVDLSKFNHIHPRRVSKLPKHHPHFFDLFNDYDYAIWIDGDMQIVNPNFVPEIMSLLDNGMVLSPHFDPRDDAYGEATIRPPKYATEPMDQQVDWYRSTGFPGHNGLYETGVIARDLTDPRVKELGMRWYIHNLLLSYQDQVSLPYVIWQMGYQPGVLPQTFRNYGWVSISPHKHESPVRYNDGRWEQV